MSVVPFGKYKGRPIEDMLADADYMAWLGAQPWFREKFAHLGQTTEAELSRTPVHNRLQGLFLDPKYCGAFVLCADPLGIQSLQKTVSTTLARQIKTSDEKIVEATDNVAKFSSDDRFNFAKHWRELADELTVIVAELRESHPTWVARSTFEVGGADVVIDVEIRHPGVLLSGYGGRSEPHRYVNSESWQGRVEIKPVVADDYPAVLRQMARHHTQYLFVGEYAGEGVTQDQFVEIFARSGKTVVFKHEVDARMAP